MFECIPTPLDGLIEIRRRVLSDERGFFSPIFRLAQLQAAGFGDTVAQVNQSHTRLPGTIRGLHFQYPPHAEAKLVSCLRGEVFDVAVDLRAGSPTFLRWHARVLSADNHTSLLVPAGFAHGFQSLRADSELLYLHSGAYEPASEGALQALDPAIGIAWPLEVSVMSRRDRLDAIPAAGFEGLKL